MNFEIKCFLRPVIVTGFMTILQLYPIISFSSENLKDSKILIESKSNNQGHSQKIFIKKDLFKDVLQVCYHNGLKDYLNPLDLLWLHQTDKFCSKYASQMAMNLMDLELSMDVFINGKKYRDYPTHYRPENGDFLEIDQDEQERTTWILYKAPKNKEVLFKLCESSNKIEFIPTVNIEEELHYSWSSGPLADKTAEEVEENEMSVEDYQGQLIQIFVHVPIDYLKKNNTKSKERMNIAIFKISPLVTEGEHICGDIEFSQLDFNTERSLVIKTEIIEEWEVEDEGEGESEESRGRELVSKTIDFTGSFKIRGFRFSLARYVQLFLLNFTMQIENNNSEGQKKVGIKDEEKSQVTALEKFFENILKCKLEESCQASSR
ncbi:MAG: hypothetical protein AB8G05_16600 [Oligoflexales bacterium]